MQFRFYLFVYQRVYPIEKLESCELKKRIAVSCFELPKYGGYLRKGRIRRLSLEGYRSLLVLPNYLQN